MPAYLADSNIWLRLAEPTHTMFAVTDRAVKVLNGRSEAPYLVPQVVAEYWRVVTSPGSQRGGFGWDVQRAHLAVEALESTFTLLADVPAIYGQWRQIILAAGVSGASIYDARLVAAMVVHGLTHILTFNVGHFQRYAPWGIVPVHPATL